MNQSVAIVLTMIIFSSAADAEIIKLECLVTESQAFFGSSSDGDVTTPGTKKGDQTSIEFSIADGVIFTTLYQSGSEHSARARITLSGQYTTVVSKPEMNYANDEGGGSITIRDDQISIGSGWFRADPINSPMWPDLGWTISLEYGNPTPYGTIFLSDRSRIGANGEYLEKVTFQCFDGINDFRELEHTLWREFTN